MSRELTAKAIKEREKKVKSVISQLQDGISLTQACKNADVGKRTLYTWSAEPGWEWIKEHLHSAQKVYANANSEAVEKSLFQRAIGYTYEEEHYKLLADKLGISKMTLVQRVRKNRPADVTALIFLLCNLSREGMTSIDWQNVYDIKIDKTKLETLDDLISSMFDPNTEKDRKKIKGKSPEFDADASEALPGETEEQRELRESLSLEMQD